MFFAVLFQPYKLSYFYTMWPCMDVGKPPEKKKKTEEVKEDKAFARDIAILQIKAYKHFMNVMLMYSFVC